MTRFILYAATTTAILPGCSPEPDANAIGSSRLPGHDVELHAEMGDWSTDSEGHLFMMAHDSSQGLCDDTVHINVGNEEVGLRVFLSPTTFRGVSRWTDSTFVVRDGVEGRFDNGAPVQWTPTPTGGVLEVTGSQWCTASGCVAEENVLTVEIEPEREPRGTVFRTCTQEGDPSLVAPSGNYCGGGAYPPEQQCREVLL